MYPAWRNFLRKKIVVFVFLTFTAICNIETKAQESDCQVPYSRQIVDAILNTDYESAHIYRQNWNQAEPDSLHPAFYQASILLAQVSDARGEAADALRSNALRLLEKVRSRLLPTTRRRPPDELILGMAEAFIARIHLDQESWIKAYSIGRQARDRLRKLVEEHPDSEDAYLVLGLYEFHTGNVPKGLKWLTYLIDLSGDRQQGLRWLERTTQTAATASPEAARILLDELGLKAPEICQWLTLNEELRNLYPDNYHHAWMLQKNYRVCGLTAEALEENRSAYRQFRQNRKARSRLLSQRLLIFRDLGDTTMMQRYHKRFRPDYFADRLAEAEAVKNRRTSEYQPPSPVRNDRKLKITPACQS